MAAPQRREELLERDEQARAASERGLRVLRARGLELEVEYPFGALRQLLGPVLREPGSVEIASLLGGAAGLALPALTGDEPPAAGAGEFAALHGIYWLLAELAAHSPMALLIDDAHWLDEASERFALFLAPRLWELPIAFISASRPRPPADGDSGRRTAAALPGSRVTRLEPLTAAATRRLVSERLEGDPGLARACAEASAGNPFYLSQLLAELQHGPEPPSAQRVRRMVPAGAARAVLGRLASGGRAAAALARAVAVLGDGAPMPVVADLADLSTADARAAGDALVAADLLAPATEPAFAHPIVRSAVYDDIPVFERSTAHRRAARLLEDVGGSVEVVAAQLLASGAEGEAWAVSALRRAAAAALRRGAPAIAADLLDRALREPPAPDERAGVLLELAETEVLARRPRAAVHFRELLASDPGPSQRARAGTGLGRVLILAGRPEEAIELLEHEYEQAVAEEPELAQVLLSELLSVAQIHPRARPRLRARLAALRDTGLAADTGPARRLLGLQAGERLLAYRPVDEVVASARAALANGRLLADETADSPTYQNVLNVLSLVGNCDEADGLRSRAIADARSRGSALAYALSSAFRGIDRLRAGRLAEAEADLRGGLEPMREHWPPGVSLAAAFLIEVLVARGALDEARAALADLGPIEGGRKAWDEVRFAARGRLALAEGDASRAAADLLESARIWQSFGVENWMVDADCAIALARAGQHDLAAELAERELAGARRCGAPRPLGSTLRAAGLLSDRARAIELLREAVTVLERSPLRLEHAHALVDLGSTLRRARRRADARAPLDAGLELALECGAEPLCAVARTELEALGARPRSIVRLGVDALTASERRVAEMAAGGMQNREIAQALFVTVKTVETQLSSTYRKLDISSRRELPRALAAPRG